jgi:DNA-binding MarR family transcriptional regulator
MTARKHIEPGTRISFRLSARERDVALTRAFLEPEIDSRLREVTAVGGQLVVDLTLDDIDDLAGCVAAEANHCEQASDRRILDGLYERLTDLERRFTNAAPASRPMLVTTSEKPRFTSKQGQYLSFIYYYTKIHGVAPAEADVQKFFKVTPPAVHGMIMSLERRALIERTPGKARSIRLRVPRTSLPDLE